MGIVLEQTQQALLALNTNSFDAYKKHVQATGRTRDTWCILTALGAVLYPDLTADVPSPEHLMPYFDFMQMDMTAADPSINEPWNKVPFFRQISKGLAVLLDNHATIQETNIHADFLWPDEAGALADRLVAGERGIILTSLPNPDNLEEEIGHTAGCRLFDDGNIHVMGTLFNNGGIMDLHFRPHDFTINRVSSDEAFGSVRGIFLLKSVELIPK